MTECASSNCNPNHAPNTLDPLTAAYDRDALLSMLFRETDRVQRMKTLFSLVLLRHRRFRARTSQLGTAAGDGLLCQVGKRTPRLLRSYDLLGRVGNDEFLLTLPGCDSFNATMLAERLRIDVFAAPFQFAARQLLRYPHASQSLPAMADLR